MFREGGENLKIISHGRARKNEPKSHENSRDREFSLCSATLVAFVGIHSALCFPVAKLSPWPAGGLNSTAPCFKPLRNLEIKNLQNDDLGSHFLKLSLHSAVCFPVAKLDLWPAGGLNFKL